MAAVVALVVVPILHVVLGHPGTSPAAADNEHLLAMGSDIAHALIGLVLLLGILVLNIYKPKGLTR